MIQNTINIAHAVCFCDIVKLKKTAIAPTELQNRTQLRSHEVVEMKRAYAKVLLFISNRIALSSLYKYGKKEYSNDQEVTLRS